MPHGAAIERLTSADIGRARALFSLMADVFQVSSDSLSDAYLTGLLARPEFWAIAASIDGELAGGLTAHTLWLTHAECREVFVFDVAIAPAYQRRGIGRDCMARLRQLAAADGITTVFVPASNDDVHALDFYHSVGGVPEAVTIFTFSENAVTV